MKNKEYSRATWEVKKIKGKKLTKKDLVEAYRFMVIARENRLKIRALVGRM